MHSLKKLLLFIVNFGILLHNNNFYAADVPYYTSNGFGTKTPGGLTDKVIKVTNLNNSGEGSFRQACIETGTRLIVFEVGGVIDLNNEAVVITNPNVTIAGQTAPNPGITLIKGNLNISTHDVVVQHISVRPGDGTSNTDGISTGGKNADVYNVVIDHCSVTWATDENLSLINTLNNHDITLYKCIIAEGLNINDHSCGSLIYGGINNLSIIGCLYAHNVRRNPRINYNTRFLLANNIFYNWGSFGDDAGDYANCVHLRQAGGAIVGNIAIGGSNTKDYGKGLYFVRGHNGTYTGEAYFENNLTVHSDGKTKIKENDRLITRLDSKPIWPDNFIAQTPSVTLNNVLKTVGARAGERDSTDTRIINSVIRLNGNIINSQAEVEGYPAYVITNHTLTVPENTDERQKWLDSLAGAIDTDDSLDVTPLNTLFSFPNALVSVINNIYKITDETGITFFCNNQVGHSKISISYYLPYSAKVILKVYNLLGNEIITITNEFKSSGDYSRLFDTGNLPEGMYLFKLQVDDICLSKKFMVY